MTGQSDDECRNCPGKTCDCDQEEEPKIGGKDTVTPSMFIPEKRAILARAAVYDLIEGERTYQKNKWRQYDDSKWAISDWVVFIRRYLKEIDDWTGHPREQMDAMRKVAGLAVAAIEFNGTRERVNGENVNLKEK